MSGKKVYIICAIVALICIFLSYHKPYVYPEHLDGIYELDAIMQTTNGTAIFPVEVFDSFGFSYYDCQAQKENHERNLSIASYMFHLKFTCGKYYGEEI